MRNGLAEYQRTLSSSSFDQAQRGLNVIRNSVLAGANRDPNNQIAQVVFGYAQYLEGRFQEERAFYYRNAEGQVLLRDKGNVADGAARGVAINTFENLACVDWAYRATVDPGLTELNCAGKDNRVKALGEAGLAEVAIDMYGSVFCDSESARSLLMEASWEVDHALAHDRTALPVMYLRTAVLEEEGKRAQELRLGDEPFESMAKDEFGQLQNAMKGQVVVELPRAGVDPRPGC
jgi:hypothetical protein